MRIFVTGGTGFIGSHVLNALMFAGHSVVALARPNSKTRVPVNPAPHWIYRPLDALEAKDLHGFDVVIHLASTGVSPQQASFADLIHWNVTISMRLLELAHVAGVRRVVMAGTSAEYGRSAEQYDFLPVTAPLQPTSLYAGSKAACCVSATAFAIEKKIEFCWLRIFSAYGDGQYEGNFYPALRQAAFSGEDFSMTAGEQLRDYVRVEDVAQAFVAASESQRIVAGKPHFENVASGDHLTMRQFAEKWWLAWGAKGRLLLGALPYRENEPMRFVPEMNRP